MGLAYRELLRSINTSERFLISRPQEMEEIETGA